MPDGDDCVPVLLCAMLIAMCGRNERLTEASRQEDNVVAVYPQFASSVCTQAVTQRDRMSVCKPIHYPVCTPK